LAGCKKRAREFVPTGICSIRSVTDGKKCHLQKKSQKKKKWEENVKGVQKQPKRISSVRETREILAVPTARKVFGGGIVIAREATGSGLTKGR